MPDQSMTVLWLLAGGLVVVSMALGVVGTAYVKLRRSLSRTAATDPKGARRTAIGALAVPSETHDTRAVAALDGGGGFVPVDEHA